MIDMPGKTLPTSDIDELIKIITDMERREDTPTTVLDHIVDTKDIPALMEKPYVRIVEEPATNLYRFRYKSEGGTAGSIPGEKQLMGRKSFPKIQLCNHEGLAALEVCCLTEDLRVHPNKLVWKDRRGHSTDAMRAGIYRATIQGNMEEEIKVGLFLSKKKDVLSLLNDKQEQGIDPFNKGYSHMEGQARKRLNLACIRLCYRVSIQQNDGTWHSLPPVVTQVVHHNMDRAELIIRDISDTQSAAAGGERKILVCDKFDTTGIQIVFHDEKSGWTGFGEFGPADIHHKSCVVFTTPAYHSLTQLTTVKMNISKIDGSAVSNTILFTYYPSLEGGHTRNILKHRGQGINTDRRDQYYPYRMRRKSLSVAEVNQVKRAERKCANVQWTNYTYQDISGI